MHQANITSLCKLMQSAFACDLTRVALLWHQWEAKQFVSLLDHLRQIPEVDGSTMLDHTVVLLCGQIGEHGHEVDQLPWVIGGGSALGFQGGRFLQFDKAPHNNLFVSLAQAMGLQTETFGNPAVCTGPLTGLRAS